jgi:hypothetical protein
LDKGGRMKNFNFTLKELRDEAEMFARSGKAQIHNIGVFVQNFVIPRLEHDEIYELDGDILEKVMFEEKLKIYSKF